MTENSLANSTGEKSVMGNWRILLCFSMLVVIFGAGKLRNIGSDLGAAVKSFKEGMNNSKKKEIKKKAKK